jgi:predicted small lipoprotein YifL
MSRHRLKKIVGFLLVMLVLLAFTVAGCGKKGPPKPPGFVAEVEGIRR